MRTERVGNLLGKPSFLIPALAAVTAIAVTSVMDASGASVFSSLALLPIALLYWFIQRFSTAKIGLIWGRGRDYFAAAAHPLLVIGALTLLVLAMHAVNVATTDWNKALLNIILVGGSTIIVALVTEEGFFRGWLWASLRRAGLGLTQTLLLTSLLFAAWHWSSVVLPTGFNPPPAQVPIFLVNAAVLGAIWGMLRMLSGSIVVSSFAHGLWNGFAYVLFGFGQTHHGALGVVTTIIYGPEIGVLGLALNLAFAALLWWWWRRRQR